MKIDDPVKRFCESYNLKKRQIIILQLLMEGLTDTEIAECINTTRRAASDSLTRIYRQTNLRNRNVIMSEIYKTALGG